MATTVRRLSSEEIQGLTMQNFTLAPIFDRKAVYAGLQGAILVAEVDGELAGCAALEFGGTGGRGGAVHIDQFAVSPRFRGHGVGGRLMKRVLDEAKTSGAEAVRAEIPGWCPEWRSFYSRFGFVFMDPDGTQAAAEETPVELRLHA